MRKTTILLSAGGGIERSCYETTLRKAGGRYPKNPTARNSFAELTFVRTDRFSHYFEDPVLITLSSLLASDSAEGMFCLPTPTHLLNS